ncbi:MAG: hypothetical protein M1838_005806 [Thelocarpon superellum]|nr:MAG: hypothetical protein M1838_005806 [Thelocarpon superellum]
MSNRPVTNNGIYSHGKAPYPVHFLCRDGGSLVPVIAVDDLPLDINIRGVPRVFASINDTVGMVNLGTVDKAASYYVIDRAPDKAPTSGPALTGTTLSTVRPQHAGAAAPVTAPPEHRMMPWRAQGESSPPAEDEHTQGLINAITASSAKKRTPSSKKSGPAGKPAQKTYCTHWLFHGECAFTHSLKGCMFKHEMPQDAETMSDVGLKTLPKWWIDRQNAELRDASWRASHGGKAGRDTPSTADPSLPAQARAPANLVTPRTGYRATRAANQASHRASSFAQGPVSSLLPVGRQPSAPPPAPVENHGPPRDHQPLPSAVEHPISPQARQGIIAAARASAETRMRVRQGGDGTGKKTSILPPVIGSGSISGPSGNGLMPDTDSLGPGVHPGFGTIAPPTTSIPSGSGTASPSASAKARSAHLDGNVSGSTLQYAIQRTSPSKGSPSRRHRGHHLGLASSDGGVTIVSNGAHHGTPEKKPEQMAHDHLAAEEDAFGFLAALDRASLQ